MNGYFDHNATTPLHPAARGAWLAAADRFWHNPSSLYREAGAARQALEDAREQVAEWLGCGAEEIVFLSGATEANNAVMRHFASAPASGNRSAAAAITAPTSQGEVLKTGNFPTGTSAATTETDMETGIRPAVSALEHPSVAEPAEHEFGTRLLRIPATADGLADLAALRETVIRSRPALVSLMAANNETGVLQPWAEALGICRESGVNFHCDAAQWIGKMPSAGLGKCDFVTGSAHKFGGPKGIGFLKVPSAGRPLRWLRGGPQEERRRAGTENLPAVAAMVAAWAAREQALNGETGGQIMDPRDEGCPSRIPPPSPEPARPAARRSFEKRLRELLPEAGIIAEHSPRLWNTVLLTVPPPGNVKWLVRLSALGFQISTGSACSQGGGASAVLRAMGVPTEKLGQVLRVSGGWETTAADWLALADAFAAVAGAISRPPAKAGISADLGAESV
ncbi:MAG: aminotransferase class V-fold PLP-dependent enzyme [Verrucomicrobiota bacterium]